MSAIIPNSFVGGDKGQWRVTKMHTVVGDSLPYASYVTVAEGHLSKENTTEAAWVLRGSKTHARYSTRVEVEQLNARQAPLGRVEADCARLIPICKNSEWWSMPQDERRKIFEEESGHTAISMPYLPTIARRLFHAREMGEPFDFLTWFEYSKENESFFEELLLKLRSSREWQFISREIDIHLEKVS